MSPFTTLSQAELATPNLEASSGTRYMDCAQHDSLDLWYWSPETQLGLQSLIEPLIDAVKSTFSVDDSPPESSPLLAETSSRLKAISTQNLQGWERLAVLEPILTAALPLESQIVPDTLAQLAHQGMCSNRINPLVPAANVEATSWLSDLIAADSDDLFLRAIASLFD